MSVNGKQATDYDLKSCIFIEIDDMWTRKQVTKKRNKTITENSGNVRFFKIEKHIKR